MALLVLVITSEQEYMSEGEVTWQDRKPESKEEPVWLLQNNLPMGTPGSFQSSINSFKRNTPK